MQNKGKQIFPLLLLFIFVNTFLLTGRSFLERQGIERDVLIIANTLFFLINFIAFLLQRRGLQNKNPNVFVRSMMAAMMIKMFVVLAALITYVVMLGKTVNKPAIYISVLLYFLYMVIEVALVMKLNKQKNA
jgi:hypothetical protein